MNSVEAIERTKNEILREYSQESEEHLDSLKATAYYNISHENGQWGTTWLVIIYGGTDLIWTCPNPYIFTPFDCELPYKNSEQYEFISDGSEICLPEDFPEDYSIEYMHIHYLATVIIDRNTQNVFFHPFKGFVRPD